MRELMLYRLQQVPDFDVKNDVPIETLNLYALHRCIGLKELRKIIVNFPKLKKLNIVFNIGKVVETGEFESEIKALKKALKDSYSVLDIDIKGDWYDINEDIRMVKNTV